MTKDQEIELLYKALEREKKARAQLEKKIDRYDKNKYEVNQELLKSYESARIQEVQLQFLAFLSKGNTDDKSIVDLRLYFAENIGFLFSQYQPLVINYEHDKIKRTWLQSSAVSAWQRQVNFDDSLLKLPCQVHQWTRSSTKCDQQLLTQFGNKFVLSIDFPLSKHFGYRVMLIIAHFCYSEEFKQTLEIAATQYIESISKRLTDAELSQNYQKLRRTLKALKSTQRQLMHSEKMASLGTLSSGVAHEINNPLSYLTSNLQSLSDYTSVLSNYVNETTEHQQCSDRLKGIVEDIPDIQSSCLDAIKRIKSIVSSLLTFSRKEEGQQSPLNIHDSINSALEIVNNQLKYKHTIKKSFTEHPALISGNDSQLQQVFVNLFINASQAMESGGELSIVTDAHNEYFTVKISDQGYGMDSSTLNRIFEPFFTTKESSKGTGLGLAISYAILTNHQATIDVNSVVGEGTSFTLSFPLTS